MSATVTVGAKTKEKTTTKHKTSSAKSLQDALAHKDLDTTLQEIKKLDNLCSFEKCKAKTSDFAISCKYCNSRFCPTHGLPEIHGCGEAVRRDEKRKFMHPDPKLSNEKHEKASTKLAMKLKQMQLERKPKPKKK